MSTYTARRIEKLGHEKLRVVIAAGLTSSHSEQRS